MQYVNPIVGTVSPNLYAAAKNAGLSASELNQVEQMSYTIKKNRELNALAPDAARKAYDALDPDVQSQLKFMYKNADYLQAPETAANVFTGALKTVGKIAASPLIGLFKVAGAYNRVINTPYLVAREAAQGADVFSKKVWTDAWNGNALFDNQELSKVTNYFGKYDVEVAKGLIAGKTPGEIVQSYGKVDSNILDSIKKAYNEPDKFKEVLDAVKFAQMSPGRDLARMLDNRPNSTVYHAHAAGSHTLSGVADFIYQIAVDPLTWMTGGLSKGATKGERIVNTITEQINKGKAADEAVADAFRDPQLKDYWDRGIGPAIEKYTNARSAVERKDAVRNIRQNFPGYANQEAIDTLSQARVHNATSAQSFFGQAKDMHLLLSGRVDGMGFMRNGVAVAKKTRVFGDNLVKNLDSFFNPARSVEQGEKDLKDVLQVLTKPEDTAGRNAADYEVLRNSNQQINKWRTWVAKNAARSPVGQEVRIGKNAAETASNFTARARLLFDRDMAETLTQHFLQVTPDEQIVILRNLDAATMYSMGLHGSEDGRNLMEKILREKYGSETSFATLERTAVNEEHAAVGPANALRVDDDGVHLATTGPQQIYQSTFTVGSLPFNEIGNMIWDIKSKKNIMNAIGGATQGKFAKELTNAWSILTLFPRLGIRSAIDEATMYALAAPTNDLLALVTRQGKKMGKIAKTFTGPGDKNVFSFKDRLHSVIGKGSDVDLVARLGKKYHIDPEHALSIEARMTAIEKYAEEKGLDSAMLSSMQKREAVGEHIANMYTKYLDGEKDLDYLLQAFKHSPDALTSMARSLVAHSALSGKWGSDVASALITPSELDVALNELGVKLSTKQKRVLTDNLSDHEVALAQFEKWHKMLVGNKARIGSKVRDGKDVVYLNPADIFFEHKGLKTGEDLRGAMDAAMQSVGFKEINNKWIVADEELANHFLTMSSHTVAGRAAGKTDAEIAEERIFGMFMDMYSTFHGSANKYNQTLFDAVKSVKAQMQATFDKPVSWNQAAAGVSFDYFQELSKGFRISGPINTAIDFTGDAENVIKNLGNQAMELMDRQVTDIFRQPAIMVTYTKLRKRYAGLEKEYVRQYVEHKAGGFPLTAREIKEYTAQGTDLAEKHFTELATREAADTILKYADNPNIRSNFAYSMRTVGRYYRATEDFYRRLYRMKDVAPRTLYRMRLSHLGLDASGMFHTDQQGNAYVVMPMDNIIFKATDGTIRALTGNTGYSQPQFSQFTLKLNMMNPSFQQDSGLPTLSGPIAGLSVVGVKNFLGTVPGKIPFIGKYMQAPAKQAGESIDTFLLGNIGDNMDITRAIVPSSLQKVWAILPFDEQSRQEVTAAQQAIAYNAAHGRYLDANATAEQKSDYLKNIRISAHNVVFLRNLLGLLAPVSPSAMESKGVPNYLKDVGMTSLRSEFFDILNGIQKTNTGEVTDAYEQALATFTGKHPGKLIYTVSREDRQTKVLVRNTDQLKTWAINNKGFIDKYGEAAYIFAPQVGTFNSSTYNWIQASGLITNKSLEKYYDDLLVAQDSQRYYDIARVEKEQLATMSDPQLRANLINEATNARDALKAANPLLEEKITGGGNGIGAQQSMLNNLEQIVDTPSAPVDASTRQRLSLAIKLVRDFIAFCSNPGLQGVTNAAALKADRKAQIEANLGELMKGDLYVTEANRAIFSSILDAYSRDSYYAYRASY